MMSPAVSLWSACLIGSGLTSPTKRARGQLRSGDIIGQDGWKPFMTNFCAGVTVNRKVIVDSRGNSK